EKQGNERIPTAILTDRDIVVGIVAQDARRLENLLVGDVVSDGLITAREEDDLGDVLTAMKYHGIRRLPVVNANGGLVGIIAFDDLIDFMAEQMSDLAKVVMKEQKVEHERRV
ncbi:CBS domain-containing protein, partial [Haliangium sp. UPWRP_2]|uniref:CBS domain-containing protein n=1 Tax=Haliangium sp. UPWRP_2 TaxID=1931276 RepID=UPI000D0DDBAB